MTKHEILTRAAEHRDSEVLHHQINIDNYRLAIEDIQANHANTPHMAEFAALLNERLQSSIREQDKEKVMLKVIRAQLAAAPQH